MEYAKKSYPAVDCFKFISCVLIIAIHAKPFEQSFWLDAGVGLITRFAVPYFFVATGYFFFKSINERKDKREHLIRYELRMLRLYVVWYVIQNLQGIIRGYIYSPWYYLRHFVLPNNGSILWFLPATMFAVFLVYEFSKKVSSKCVLMVSLVIWICGYLMSTLAPIFTGSTEINEFVSNFQRVFGIQNGLFFGFPYIALANYISKGTNGKKQVKRLLICLIVSVGFLGVESLFVVTKLHPALTFLWISAFPMTYFAFRITLNLDVDNNHVFLTMRKISTLVYVIHPIVLAILKDLISKNSVIDSQNLLLFFGTTATSIFVAYIIYRLSNIEKLFFLKLIM